MTPEQKKWMDEHPDYHMLGQAGGNVRYRRRGTLLPDGTFEPVAPNKRPGYAPNSFGVGVREIVDPGKMPNPRANFGGTSVPR